MTDFQGPMTLDIYRVLMETMQELLVSNEFFDEIYEYAIRVEFQGRGTLHIHVVAWAIIQAGVKITSRVVDKNGRRLCDYCTTCLSRMWMYS